MSDQNIFDLSVWTDLPDYAPGETVFISTSGGVVGSTIDFSIADDPNDPGDDGEADVYQSFQATDGVTIFDDNGIAIGGDLDGVADGNITTTWIVPTDNNGTGSGIPDALNATLILTATGDGEDGTFGTTDDQVATTSFTDAGGAYTLNFSAADPSDYIPPIPFPADLTAPTGRGDGNPLIPLALFNDGAIDVKVESLAPQDMALGQIVPFELKIIGFWRHYT